MCLRRTSMIDWLSENVKVYNPVCAQHSALLEHLQSDHLLASKCSTKSFVHVWGIPRLARFSSTSSPETLFLPSWSPPTFLPAHPPNKISAYIISIPRTDQYFNFSGLMTSAWHNLSIQLFSSHHDILHKEFLPQELSCTTSPCTTTGWRSEIQMTFLLFMLRSMRNLMEITFAAIPGRKFGIELQILKKSLLKLQMRLRSASYENFTHNGANLNRGTILRHWPVR